MLTIFIYIMKYDYYELVMKAFTIHIVKIFPEL